MQTQFFAKLASVITALRNCERNGNAEWAEKHSETIATLMREAPSGSGFDAGTQLELDECTPSKLVFSTSFHHMNGNGYYDGWTEHKVIVTPAFNGVDIRVTGRNRNDIKEYIADTFHSLGATICE